MKGIKKSLGISFSVVLLLSFSMTLIPLDFFHYHQQISQGSCAKDKAHASCPHKFHITKKADFCWACAVHFDKTFTKVSFLEKLKLSPGLSFLINNETVGYFLEPVFTALRGPPSE